VSAPQQSALRNQLLARLAPEDFAPLQRLLEPVELELRRVLIEPNRPIEHVYFHERGYTSITTNGQGNKIEVGLIGREGMVGVPVALGVRTTPLQFFIQLAGDGLRMTSHDLEEVMDERPSLHRVLLRYAQVMNVQTSGTAFGNAEHTVETRLARWLLMCHDRAAGHWAMVSRTASRSTEGNSGFARKRAPSGRSLSPGGESPEITMIPRAAYFILTRR